MDLDLPIDTMVGFDQISGFHTCGSCGTLCTPNMWSSNQQSYNGWKKKKETLRASLGDH